MTELNYTIEGRSVLILDGDYRLWPDGQRWRWSRSNYPDDGVGIPGYGAQLTLSMAAGAALTHAETMERLPDNARSYRYQEEPADWQARLLEELRRLGL